MATIVQKARGKTPTVSSGAVPASTSFTNPITAGHVLLLMLNGAATWNAPAGYTAIGGVTDFMDTRAYWRVSDGTESQSPVFTMSSSTNGGWTLWELKDVDSASFVDTFATATNTGSNIATAVTGTATTTNATDLLVAIVGSLGAGPSDLDSGGVASWSNGFVTEDNFEFDIVNGSSTDWISVATATVGSTGSYSSTATFVRSNFTTHANGMLIALRSTRTELDLAPPPAGAKGKGPKPTLSAWFAAFMPLQVAYGTTGSSNSATIPTVKALQAQPTEGNQLLLITNTSYAITAPAGYTPLESVSDFMVTAAYVRTVDGTESLTPVITQGGSGFGVWALIELDAAVGFDVGATATNTGSALVTANTGSATTTHANDVLFAITGALGANTFLDFGGAASWDNGFYPLFNVESDTSNPGGSLWLSIATHGVTSTGTYTANATSGRPHDSTHVNGMLLAFQVQAFGARAATLTPPSGVADTPTEPTQVSEAVHIFAPAMVALCGPSVTPPGAPAQMWIFRPPYVDEGPVAFNVLMGRYKLARGVSVIWNQDDTFTQTRFPTTDDFAAAKRVFLGGYEHVVDEDTRDVLVTHGYSGYVSKS